MQDSDQVGSPAHLPIPYHASVYIHLAHSLFTKEDLAMLPHTFNYIGLNLGSKDSAAHCDIVNCASIH